VYFAVKGQGTWLDGQQRLRVSKIDCPENAVACIGGLKGAARSHFAPRLTTWMRQFWALRSLGGCLDAMLVASGKAEIWIEPEAKAWDLAPLKIIIEEAGGRFFNFDGNSSIYGGNAAACVPALEPAVRELVELS
jgi:fructose-1,6-bisphosphatase/inositol monophosphatase family enzyme